ncbi:hypothetical protein KUV95_17170 [Microbulbifer agarilyticus]|uniref:hypothetical protein n=1 Tax=Microbulbifer agarilyticus TaxID=260552 RepID=UPI001C94C4AC|nr:hypothetical protein [Microbulbifer agarilyticus]MBY6213277.1 hypothetical protein [Microbulbifer agarilyticus]
MKRQLQIFGLILGFISLTGGLIDVALQYAQGDSAVWRIPVLLIGFGVGLPLCIIPYFDWSQKTSSATHSSEQEYAQNNLSGGFLASNYEAASGAEASDFENCNGE